MNYAFRTRQSTTRSSSSSDIWRVELFLGKSRRVELTAIGAGYYPLIRTAFDEITAGTDQILAPEAPGILTVQVYSTFAIRWLIPRLGRFQSAHPEVQVRLHTSQDDVDFQHEDVDVCVMIGTRADPDVHYDFLFAARMFPVCSPGLLADGPFEDVGDLAQHTILQVYPSAEDWHVWLAENKVLGVDPDSGLQLDSYELAMRTAMQGGVLRSVWSRLSVPNWLRDCWSSLSPTVVFIPAATITSHVGNSGQTSREGISQLVAHRDEQRRSDTQTTS